MFWFEFDLGAIELWCFDWIRPVCLGSGLNGITWRFGESTRERVDEMKLPFSAHFALLRFSFYDTALNLVIFNLPHCHYPQGPKQQKTTDLPTQKTTVVLCYRVANIFLVLASSATKTSPTWQNFMSGRANEPQPRMNRLPFPAALFQAPELGPFPQFSSS
ncbi:hypothetical protein Ddc_15562 [Ditylenchus destructor]|nr:hypothetical protein Ddc_15562 [Ditylenchus destructor]